MPTPDEHEQVSTEPQRQALDAMSHKLVENLNAMIREQNERAERFAATQHSVSALPGQVELPHIEAPIVPPSEPIATAVPPLPSTGTQPPRQPSRRKATLPPPRPRTPLDNGNPRPLPPPRPRIKIPTAPAEAKQQGCSATTVFVAIVIFLFLIRSCS